MHLRHLRYVMIVLNIPYLHVLCIKSKHHKLNKIILWKSNKVEFAPDKWLLLFSYAVDLVVCCALGVDMFDCVYPTRTAVSGLSAVLPMLTIIGPLAFGLYYILISMHSTHVQEFIFYVAF